MIFSFLHVWAMLYIFELSQSSSHGDINDNYCDRADGSDETRTSACAGVLSAPQFFCRGSGFLNISIPLSRVQDGVCDCCDGEDETGSPFFGTGADASAACPEKCSEQLLELKTEALSAYKHISAGLRAKADVVNVMNRKKLREKQSYDGLLREYTEVQKLYYQIKYWLERDTKVESTLMFKELRSRVRKCAEGFFESCDYFHDGSNIMYQEEVEGKEGLLYDFPELWDEQPPLPDHLDTSDDEDDEDDEDGETGTGPGVGSEGGKSTQPKRNTGNLDPSKLGNSVNRKKFKSVSEKIDEVIKKNQAKDKMLSQLNGPQRVENSFCAFEEADTVGFLGGEESLRVHKNVKQYLEWVTGKGGRAARKLTVEQTRAKTTLFGPYLDSGSGGRVVGLQVLFEMVGLVLSPVTVAYTHLMQFYTKSKKAFHQRAQTCLLELEGNEDRSMLRRTNDVAEYAEYLPCNNFMLLPYRAVLEMGDEESPLATALLYLDYNNYNFFMTHVVSRVAPYINSNMWYFRIIQQTPYYYYRYYFGDGASHLPVYRNACILREGLRVARIEAEELRSKIATKRQQVEAEGGVVDSELGADGRITLTGSGSGVFSSLQSSFSADAPDRESVDFGADGSWLALNGTCLSRHEGQYVYKVCPFAQVFQDHVNIGTFSHWGDKPLAHKKKKQTSQSKMMSFKNRIHNKQKEIEKSASDYLSNLVSGSEDEGVSAATGNSPTSYTKQFYGDGTACHNGIVRHAVVEYQCAAFAEIVDVVEYEMCGYALKVNTPIACTRDMEEAVLRRLQQLDVYGFGASGSKESGDSKTDMDQEEPASDAQEEVQKKRKEKQQQAGDKAVEIEVKDAAYVEEADSVTVVETTVDAAVEATPAITKEKKRKTKAAKEGQDKKPFRVTFNK